MGAALDHLTVVVEVAVVVDAIELQKAVLRKARSQCFAMRARESARDSFRRGRGGDARDVRALTHA